MPGIAEMGIRTVEPVALSMDNWGMGNETNRGYVSNFLNEHHFLLLTEFLSSAIEFC